MAPRFHSMRIAACVALLTLVSLSSLVVFAADKGFGGKWKGEIAAAPRGSGSRGVPGATGNQFAQGRGRGVLGGGLSGGLSGPQKVTLNLKTKDQDTKATGNITLGESTQDITDGKIEGTIITFRSGRAPSILEYRGELQGDEIRMTRTSANGGQPVQFVLKRS